MNIYEYIKTNVATLGGKIYISPQIPQKHIENAITAFKFDENPKGVIALCDNTLFGNAKSGLLFTESKLVFKENSNSLPITINYKAINDIELQKKQLTISNSNQVTIVIKGLSSINYKHLKILLLDIKTGAYEIEKRNQNALVTGVKRQLDNKYKGIITELKNKCNQSLGQAKLQYQTLNQKYQLLIKQYKACDEATKKITLQYQKLEQQHQSLIAEKNLCSDKVKEIELQYQALEQEYQLLTEQYELCNDNATKIELQYQALTQEHQLLTEQYKTCNDNVEKHEQQYQTLSQEHQSLIEQHNVCRETAEKAQSQYQALNQEHKNLTEQYSVCKDTIKKVQSQYHTLNQEHQTLIEQHNVCKETAEKTQLQYQELEQKHQEISSNLDESNLRHELIAALLSADQTHKGVNEFRKILNEDYLKFDNEELSLRDSAAILVTLQSLLEELEIIGAYPDFHKKRTIAVAGGFSTGKSEFISSLFQQHEMRLPIGMEPTTAIPTYVMTGEQSEVLGCSIKGGTVDLLQIDPHLQSKLSHDFIRTFGFRLKSIMPYIFLSTKIPYQNLCFIDTPGYNPSETGFTTDDEETAQDFINRSEAVLWLIGADANGTIPQSDIEFLEHVTEQKKPLFIILNKADIKPLDDIEDIIETIIEELEDADISINGISAYSSIQCQELMNKELSLDEFLNSIDKPSDKRKEVSQTIKEMEEKYSNAITEDKKKNEETVKNLRKIQFDLFENSQIELSDDVSLALEEMMGKFAIAEASVKKRQDKLSNIMKKFRNAVNHVFGELPEHASQSMNNHVDNDKTVTDLESAEKSAQSLPSQEDNSVATDEKVTIQEANQVMAEINTLTQQIESEFQSTVNAADNALLVAQKAIDEINEVLSDKQRKKLNKNIKKVKAVLDDRKTELDELVTLTSSLKYHQDTTKYWSDIKEKLEQELDELKQLCQEAKTDFQTNDDDFKEFLESHKNNNRRYRRSGYLWLAKSYESYGFDRELDKMQIMQLESLITSLRSSCVSFYGALTYSRGLLQNLQGTEITTKK